MLDDQVNILGQHVAFRYQLVRRRLHLGEIGVAALIALCDGKAWIAGLVPFCLGAGKGNEGALQRNDFGGRAGGSVAEIPARIGGQRHRDFRQPDAARIIAILVHRRHQEGQLGRIQRAAAIRAVAARNPGWRLHAGNGGEVQIGMIDQGAITQAGIAIGRRLYALADPAIHSFENGAHRHGVIVRIAPLLTRALGRREGGRAVLGAGPHIDAHIVRQFEVGLAVQRGVKQRRIAAAAGILHFAIGIDDLGHHRWAHMHFHAIGLAGDRILLRHIRVGEHRACEDAKAILRRERVDVIAARRAGNLRPHHVISLAALLVGIETVIEEFAHKAAGLRRAIEIGVFGRNRHVLAIADRRGYVANGGVTQAQHGRILGGIDQVITLTGDKTRLQVERGGIGNDFAILHAGELPLVARNRFGLVEGAGRHLQHIVLAVHVRRRIARCVRVHLQGRAVLQDDPGRADAEGIDLAGHRLAAFHGDGKIDRDHARLVINAVLPADPDERKAFLEQGAVAILFFFRRLLAKERLREGGGEAAPAAIGGFEERHAIAFGGVLGPVNINIGRKFHHALGVARRLVEVRNDFVAGIARINGEIGGTDQLFISAGVAPGLAAQNIPGGFYLDA